MGIKDDMLGLYVNKLKHFLSFETGRKKSKGDRGDMATFGVVTVRGWDVLCPIHAMVSAKPEINFTVEKGTVTWQVL